MSLLEDHEEEKDGGLAVTQLTASQEEAIQEQEFKYATLLQVRNNLKDITSLKCKSDFLTFVKLMAPTLVSDWKMGKHIEVISDKLQKVVDGKIKRLMVFLPPRSSKSVICSKLFPAWYMGKNPNHEILTVSHSDQLSSDFGRAVRDIVGTEEFTTIFPEVNLRQDVRAAGKWKTNLNGSYYAAGVRSQIAGRGAHVAILDDAMSEEDSFSDAGRRYIKQWWPSGLRTRIMPNGAIIIINTRYHYDDLCGWLLKQQDKFDIDTDIRWDVVSIPAWVDEDSSKLLGLPIGTSYFPEWKSDEILKQDEMEIRSTNGSKYWESLYMQNPTPDEGSLIKKDWVSWWEYGDPPSCDFILQTYDTAFSTKTTADYSVIQTWGVFHFHDNDLDTGDENVASNIILLGSKRGRYEYPDLRRIAQEEYRRHRPDFCLVEKKASGQSLIQDMRRSGLPVLEYMPDRDKVSRVISASPMLESGRVWLPDGKSWSNELYEEMIMFPYGKHDDQVDAMTMAIHYIKDSWRLEHPDDPDWEDDQSYRKQKRVAYWRV
jgi:predicted phage terminase large subunit-like protein